jgi:hypothetical protein
MREDASFHMVQNLQAAVRQYLAWQGDQEASPILIAAARYLAAHSPTSRARHQTAQVARRLMRGGALHEDGGEARFNHPQERRKVNTIARRVCVVAVPTLAARRALRLTANGGQSRSRCIKEEEAIMDLCRNALRTFGAALIYWTWLFSGAVARSGGGRQNRSAWLRLGPVRLFGRPGAGAGGAATKSLDQDRLAEYMHKASFKTVSGDFSFGKDGEWSTSRMFWTQIQNAQPNNLEQFRDGSVQPIVWPPEHQVGRQFTPEQIALAVDGRPDRLITIDVEN